MLKQQSKKRAWKKIIKNFEKGTPPQDMRHILKNYAEIEKINC